MGRVFLFSHLVAARVADAVQVETFKDLLDRLEPQNIQVLKNELEQLTTLN